MKQPELIEKLLATGSRKTHRSLLKKNLISIDLKLAENLKNTCYDSWTKEPQKTRRAAQVLKILCELISDAEAKAFSDWVAAIVALTDGKLEKAIGFLDAAAEIFTTLEKPQSAAQTQVSKLYALALLGRYDEAVVCGESALKTFKSGGDELAAGKIEHNLGNLFYRRENYGAAKRYFHRARACFLKLKDSRQLTMIETNLAAASAGENDFREAEKFYKTALTRARRVKMFVTEADIEACMGNLALFRGKLDRALHLLELSRRKYETLQMPHQTAIAELEIADVYIELNLNAEAAAIYEKVADQLHKLKMQGEEARARANFGRVAANLNDVKRARRELKNSARLYVLENNRVGAATVKLNEARLELDLRNYQKVLRLAEESEIFLAESGNSRHLLNASWLQAEALRNLGQNRKARKMLAQIFTEAIEREQPNTAQTAQTSLGKLAVQEKNYVEAEKHFNQAIRLIETMRAPLAAEEFRMAFLANKLAPFEGLARIYLAENKIEKAFAIVERARARVLAESLDDPDSPTAAGQNKIPVKLKEKLEALREELNWYYSRLNRSDEAASGDLQREAKKREKQIADLLRQIAATGESKFGAPEFLDFERLRNQLGDRRSLVEFVIFDGVLSAFVVTGESIRFIADLAKESEVLATLKDLQFQFGSLRYGAQTLERFMPELKKRADFHLRKLYEKLLKPLENFIGKRDLTIIPAGALHYVPFHALFDGAKYQIEIRRVNYAPSATVWQFLASKPQRKLKNALLIGCADERIPLVGREIENLKEIFSKAKSYTDDEATVAAFTKNAARFDVLHLACHGRFRPENPLFSSLYLADGRITVRDVRALKLNAEIVTLSACETGLNKIFAGDEILGLAGGFLAAGAKSLCLSLWTVNDEATTVLIGDFYRELQSGKSAAEALRIAQCDFIERGVHPYFWSPFALIGR